MQKMYVANLTRQVQDFIYRLPETNQPRRQVIQIGGQIQVSGELTTLEIEAIVRQHTAYGLVSVVEARKSTVCPPLVYSLDRHIPPELIEELSDRNTEMLDVRGREQRKEAAIVITNKLGRSMLESGREEDLEEVEVEMIEDDDQKARTRRGATGGDRLKETVVVTREDRVGKRGRAQNRQRA